MTEYDTANRFDTDAIIEAARLGVTTTPVELGTIHLAPQADGSVKVIDLTTAAHLAQLDALDARNGVDPVRKTGRFTLTEHASFSRYVRHHGQQLGTELWADRDAGRITAVLNGHMQEDDTAGRGDHRATLALKHTPAWAAWLGINGRQLPQAEFADFLEDHLPDVKEPDGAHLLEVATSIQASVGAAMKAAVRLDNGQVQVRYEETIDGSAGKAGELEIPTRIALGLAPFEGGDPYKVTARLRWRLTNGTLTLGVVLDQLEDVLRNAFGDIVAEVEKATDLAVLYGTPAG
ncbi:YfdQ family protein [Aquihabitans sp. G128]|uniref:DUF2303 family protein n=1 Tax=Aquihabitans sp. G128 TaxID=2849779 RepID=UPI001C23A059|nr:DUF2303 family protein [Aquihabitans sp. G128]QXC59352.1 YfdQ family protein [Aquihabitans sp. G128]